MSKDKIKGALTDLIEDLLKEALAEESIVRRKAIETPDLGLQDLVGEKVIVRTYSAGVFYGTLKRKSGNEVILSDARRLWEWHAEQSISLSGVALYGIKHKTSRITAPLPLIWLEAIEIIPTTQKASESIESAEETKAS